jgi:hypothetical protein
MTGVVAYSPRPMRPNHAPSLLRTLLLAVGLTVATAWLGGQPFPSPANAIVNCDDGVPCTQDSFVGTCLHVPDASACNDGTACTADSCDLDVGCLHAPIDCDDKNACTIDTCDAELGCVHSQVDCDDNDACTADSCDPVKGCIHTRTCADTTYLCYDTKASKKAPKFVPIPNVHVTDFFENLYVTVTQPREICNPAGHEVLGGGDVYEQIAIPDTATHLNRYQITVPKKTPRNMQKNVQVETEFGSFAVDLVIGDKLFVPTAKAIGQPPLPLEAVDAEHYKCYDVKLHSGKFPKNIQVSLVDQFLLTPQTFTLTGVSHLCPVAQKNTEPVYANCAVLACFDVKPVTPGGSSSP